MKVNVTPSSFINACTLVTLTLLSAGALAQYKPAITGLQSFSSYRVNRDGSAQQVLEERIRIDTAQGLELYGERKINFNATLENVEVVEAYSLHPDGTRVDVPVDKIRTQDQNDEGEGIYSDSKAKVIIYGNLVVGSQVYYRARAVQHTPDFPGHFFWERYFTPHMRYEDVVIELEHDPAINIKVDALGMKGGQLQERDALGFIKYRYNFSQEQAHPFEKNRAALSDFAPHFAASSFESYADVAQAYQVRANPKSQPTPAIRDLAHRLTRHAQTTSEKVRALYLWVSQNIRYLGVYVGDGGYVPHDAQSILDNRYGDCKDHVVLLEALLTSVGIESTPVLLNSSDAYLLPKVPTPGIFDHVITYVPELKLYLDSTSRFAPMGVLPDADTHKPVLHTASGQLSTTPAYNPDHDYTKSHVKLDVMSDGRVKGTSSAVMRGVFEVESRANQFSHLNKSQADLVDRLLSRHQESGSGRIEKTEPNKFEDPWQVTAEFLLDPVVNVPGPSAMGIPLGLMPGKIKSYALHVPVKNRRFPTACSSSRHTEITELRFAPGLKVQRIPKNIRFNHQGLSYRSNYVRKGQVIEVVRELVLKRDGVICHAADEQNLEKLVTVLRRDFRQQIFFD